MCTQVGPRDRVWETRIYINPNKGEDICFAVFKSVGKCRRCDGGGGDSYSQSSLFIREVNISSDIISTFNAESVKSGDLLLFHGTEISLGSGSLMASIRSSCWAVGTHCRKLPLSYVYLVLQITPSLYQMETASNLEVLHF